MNLSLIKRFQLLVTCLAGCSVFVLSFTNTNFCDAQTPSGWLIHDEQRPQPRVIQPAPQKQSTKAPSDAIVLFDGTSLDQWRSVEGGPARWVIRDGYMESVPDSGKLVSAAGFGNIQLHVEWAAPAKPEGKGQSRGNSGVFLMGEYEIQILDCFGNTTYPDGQAAALYGQYPPLVNACLPPGEWQSYDIIFRRPCFDQHGELLSAAQITVLHNGVVVHAYREMWGPTSWLKNDPYIPHADSLPIALQDHGNPIRFRNIWLRELPDEDQRPAEPTIRPYYAIDPIELERLVGSYMMEDGPLVEITREKDSLFFQISGRQQLSLVPESQTKFNFFRTAGHLIFLPDGEGNVNEFEFHLGSRTNKIIRIPSTVVDF